MTSGIFLGLAAAGALGAPTRHVVDELVLRRRATAAESSSGGLPWGIFVVNVSGSLLLGVITGAALYHGFPETPRVVLGAGFCGSYTTFSTFTFDTLRLVEDGALRGAFANVMGSLLAGTLAAALGLAIASLL